MNIDPELVIVYIFNIFIHVIFNSFVQPHIVRHFIHIQCYKWYPEPYQMLPVDVCQKFENGSNSKMKKKYWLSIISCVLNRQNLFKKGKYFHCSFIMKSTRTSWSLYYYELNALRQKKNYLWLYSCGVLKRVLAEKKSHIHKRMK